MVGGDFSFYQFPGSGFWRELFGRVTLDRSGSAFKVPEEITAPTGRSRPLRRPRDRASASFLDARLFDDDSPGRWNLSRPGRHPDLRVRDHPEIDPPGPPTPGRPLRLPGSLSRVSLCVEIRNSGVPGARAISPMPHSPRVAHVFNAWTRMPDLVTSWTLPDAFTADFTVTRAFSRGRAYEQAVKIFEPYDAPGTRPLTATHPTDRRAAWQARRARLRLREQSPGRQCKAATIEAVGRCIRVVNHGKSPGGHRDEHTRRERTTPAGNPPGCEERVEVIPGRELGTTIRRWRD